MILGGVSTDFHTILSISNMLRLSTTNFILGHKIYSRPFQSCLNDQYFILKSLVSCLVILSLLSGQFASAFTSNVATLSSLIPSLNNGDSASTDAASINAVKAACSGSDDGCSGGYKGGNITNIGATISGGSLVYLTADNNITNKALVQYNINGTNSYSSGLSSGQTSANFSNTTLDNDGISSSDTNVQSSSADHISSTLISQGNITSGGDLVLVAGNNLNNIGSNITSTGSSYLEATNGNINVTTSALRDRSLTRWGGSKKGGVSVTDNTTNIASNITSGSSGVGTLEFLT